MFTFADRTTAWSVQAGPFPERKTTLTAIGRFQYEMSRVYRFYNMLKMIKDLSLFDPEQFRNSPHIQGFSL
jgi:hypothetical protein